LIHDNPSHHDKKLAEVQGLFTAQGGEMANQTKGMGDEPQMWGNRVTTAPFSKIVSRAKTRAPPVRYTYDAGDGIFHMSHIFGHDLPYYVPQKKEKKKKKKGFRKQ